MFAPTSNATAERSNATPTTSFKALPASSSTSSGVASTTAIPIMLNGAAPNGLPMHHAARSASASQNRFRSGDSTSLPTNKIPSVQELGGRRVEHGQRVAVREMQPRRPSRLDESSCDWHVIPERVRRRGHSALERIGNADGPFGGDQRDRTERGPAFRVFPAMDDIRALRTADWSIVRLPARRHAATPEPTNATTIGTNRNRPTLPRSSETQTMRARAMMISANTAGAP